MRSIINTREFVKRYCNNFVRRGKSRAVRLAAAVVVVVVVHYTNKIYSIRARV